MEPRSAFKFPAERVSTRPLSTMSINTTATTHSASRTTDMETQDFFTSPNASPTRRAKASLFADATTPTSKVSGFALPQSPSLPEIHALRSHVRTNSDVQGLVKRFEHLDVRDRDAESVERRNRHEAELRRAQIAREEAESDARRLREEVRRLKKEGDESRERERRVAKRLEVVLEDYGNSKEGHESQHAVYEKELRKSRKEAFKSSSAVLKLQEELKSTRASLRITQSGLDLEKQKVQRKEQERFEMEYRLIPLQEEMEKLKQKLRTVEQERETLKTALKEEEVARIAAEGLIALPPSQDLDLDLLSSPRKPKSPSKNWIPMDPDEDKENMQSVTKKGAESKRLAEELDRERMRREHAEEMIDFLRAECMFQCCGCKTASRLGHDLAVELDAELAAGVEMIRLNMGEILTATTTPVEMDDVQATFVTAIETGVVSEVVVQSDEEVEAAILPDDGSQNETDIEKAVTETAALDRSTTMTAESPIQMRSPDDQLREEEADAIRTAPEHQEADLPDASPSNTEQAPDTVPETPPRSASHHQITPLCQQPSIRTITTTTTIPMHFTPSIKHLPSVFDLEDTQNVPPTPSSAILPDGSEVPVFDRAAALAAIEYRRGRAKSMANGQATPRKQMLEGVKERRDISAPALGQIGSVGKGLGSLRGRR